MSAGRKETAAKTNSPAGGCERTSKVNSHWSTVFASQQIRDETFLQEVKELIEESASKAYKDGFAAGREQTQTELEEIFTRNSETSELRNEVKSVREVVSSCNAALDDTAALVSSKILDASRRMESIIDERLSRAKEEQLSSMRSALSHIQDQQVKLVTDTLTEKESSIYTNFELALSRLKDELYNSFEDKNKTLRLAVESQLSDLQKSFNEMLEAKKKSDESKTAVRVRALDEQIVGLKNDVEAVRRLHCDTDVSITSLQEGSLSMAASLNSLRMQYHQQRPYHQSSSPTSLVEPVLSLDSSAQLTVGTYGRDAVNDMDAVSGDDTSSAGGSISELSATPSEIGKLHSLDLLPPTTGVGQEVLYVVRKQDDKRRTSTIVQAIIRKIYRSLVLKVPKHTKVRDSVSIDTSEGPRVVPFAPGERVQIGSLFLKIPTNAKAGKSIIWEDVGKEGLLRYDIEVVADGRVERTWAKNLRIAPAPRSRVRFASLK